MLGRSRYDALGAAGRYRPEPFSNEVMWRGDGLTKYVTLDALTAELYDTTSAWTWILLVRADTPAAGYALMLSDDTAAGPFYGLGVGFGAGNDKGRFRVRNAASVYEIDVETTPAVSDADEHLWIVTDVAAAGTGTVKSSVDGAARETLGTYARGDVGGFDYLTFGAGRLGTPTPAGYLDGDIGLAARVDREISDAECADLYAFSQAHRMDLRQALGDYYPAAELLPFNLWFGDGVDGDKLVNRGKYLGHPTKGTAQPVNVVDADFVLRAA